MKIERPTIPDNTVADTYEVHAFRDGKWFRVGTRLTLDAAQYLAEAQFWAVIKCVREVVLDTVED